MASIDSLFINVQTSGVASVPLSITTAHSTNGKPVLKVASSGTLPEGVTLRVLAYPSGAMGDALFTHLVDPTNSRELANYQSSGFYYHKQTFNTSGIYNISFNIVDTDGVTPTYENTWYKVGYNAFYADNDAKLIYAPVTELLTDQYLIPTAVPEASRLQVTTSLSSTESTSSRLNLNIIQNREITNRGLSAPKPYLVMISGVAGYYTPTGSITSDPSGIANFFDYSLSGMALNLPYISGTQTAPDVYDIQLGWLDQQNNVTPLLIFNTQGIKTSVDEFDDGDLSAFTDVSVKRIGEIPIKSDVLKKKRYSVGIEDLALVNETFKKQGVWISDYYTIEDPIYTFFLRVGETMPSSVDVPPYDMVKYYVQFANQDWIRISPVNRGDELDEDGAIVSKFFVLDRLNLGKISTDLKELPYEFPVFSFRIRIEIDMNFLASKSFISPSIDYYECHVTDRNSFLRIE